MDWTRWTRIPGLRRSAPFLRQGDVEKITDGSTVFVRFADGEDIYECRVHHGVAYSKEHGSNMGVLNADENEISFSLSDFLPSVGE